ncbi:hypothetical protein VDG1235_164 [Verrucomicrobiia bacterium DG1235]|nr:hypothetical protein VDG1235_164 [Verrucomicrobiae bacterium DG1235]
MRFLDKLERKFGFLAIHGLTNYIVVGQAITFLLVATLRPEVAGRVLELMEFRLVDFLRGHIWNPFSFILIPKNFSLIWIFFTLSILHMMGTALEQHWGAFRYNLYILVGIVAVVFSGITFPYHSVSSYFLLTSVFLAFSYLYPNIELNLFFVLPVKMKWLGLLSVVLAIMFFFEGNAAVKLEIVASLINFPIFFGADIVRGFRSKQRVREMKSAKRKLDAEPFHTCAVCGATDLTHPERDFRYRDDGAICSDCLGEVSED